MKMQIRTAKPEFLKVVERVENVENFSDKTVPLSALFYQVFTDVYDVSGTHGNHQIALAATGED